MLTTQNKPNKPSYFCHYDILKSLINRYNNEHRDTMFVTIQPAKDLFTREQVKDYLIELFPTGLNAVVQLERNDKVNLQGKYKSYDLLPTLHIHLVTSKEQLVNVSYVYYNNNTELKKIKLNKHITACPLFNTEGLVKYLVKQYHQNLQPYKFCFSKAIYKEREMKEKAPFDAFWLLQMVTSGTTYAEIKQQCYKLNKDLMQRSLKTELIKLNKDQLTNANLINCFNDIPVKVLQVKPNPPNIQTVSD